MWPTSCHHFPGESRALNLAVIVLLLSTAIMKQMLDRLKKKRRRVTSGFFLITSGICHHANLDYLIGKNCFLILKTLLIYIIIQKKWMSATTPFPWKITQEALGSMTVLVSQDKVRGCIYSWQQPWYLTPMLSLAVAAQPCFGTQLGPLSRATWWSVAGIRQLYSQVYLDRSCHYPW